MLKTVAVRKQSQIADHDLLVHWYSEMETSPGSFAPQFKRRKPYTERVETDSVLFEINESMSVDEDGREIIVIRDFENVKKQIEESFP